ncbi:MAG: phenylalanine--tRNA ligase subunit beta [Pseudomonadota bacterium]|nr:phenylalanine--tRNA ligase subunit beta [Pseudomonadota bacterium]
MKVSESWLRELVNPALDSDALAHQLTMAGLEVDDNSPVAVPFSGVLVGEVLTVEQHPDADRLRVTTVNIGSAEPLQIVCGAPNVVVGARVPVATVGAVLPKDFKIKKGKLRGVESHGMLCGASEIGLEDTVDGLLILPNDAPIGQDIRAYLNLDDRVIELGITPNRGDCLSVRGLARELGVLNQLAVQDLHVEPVPATTELSKNVHLNDSGCPRYAGRVISGINPQATTPAWMAEKLRRCGLRSHSLLVDITNYVLLALGQPMHAFDVDQLQGDLSVRMSTAGEQLKLLNEQQVTLDDDTLLICDERGAVALAGVMGGFDSRVTDATQNIFLESAFFAPLAIAGRARRYGLHTDASQRYERGVDYQLPLLALEYATQLIVQYAGGQVGAVVLAERLEDLPVRSAIELTLANTSRLLGFDVSAEFVVESLQRLGMRVTGDALGWQVTPPSHRFDLSIAEDLIEEVARIFGYDNIPVRLPVLSLQLQATTDHLSLAGLRQTLVGLGYQEAISFSFSDEKLEKKINPAAQPLMLANPISSDLAAMRTTLLSSLIPSVQHNVNRQQSRVRLFETGLRFMPSTDGIEKLAQIPTLALIATGGHVPEQWHAKPKAMDFYDLKAELEMVLQAGRVTASYIRAERAWLHPGQSADIVVNGQVVGYLGRLHPALETALDLAETFVAELDLDVVMLPYVSNFTQLSRFPSVRRDIAILISDKIDIDQIQASIQTAAGSLLIQCWLFDVYAGQGIESGQRSLAFALLWQHPDRTLEDVEIKEGMQRVIDALAKTYNATLRAS